MLPRQRLTSRSAVQTLRIHWMVWDSSFLLRKTYLSSGVPSVASNLKTVRLLNMSCYRAFVGEPTSKKGATELIELCQADLTPLLGFKSAPQFAIVSKHSQAMAQYQVGHQDVVSDIERFVNGLRGFALAGNGYDGIGIPDCIRSGETAALSLLDTL